MGKLVQYNTVEAVIEAFEDSDIPAFAVFHDRQLIFKRLDNQLGANAAFLETKLEAIKASGTYGIYTICMYESIPKDKKITASTPPDESFNFQLNKGEGAAGVGRISGIGGAGLYTQEQLNLAVENALLRKRLDELEARPEMEETETGALMGAVDKILNVPGVPEMLGAIAGRVSEFIAGIGRPVQQYDELGNPITMRKISGIEGAAGDVERIETAIGELQKILPDLPDLLEKLVSISKDKWKWNFFLAGLRGMKI